MEILFRLLRIAYRSIQHGGVVQPPPGSRTDFAGAFSVLKDRFELLFPGIQFEAGQFLGGFPSPNSVFKTGPPRRALKASLRLIGLVASLI